MADKYNSKLAAIVGRINKAPYGFAVTVSKNTTLYSTPEGMVGTTWRTHEDCHKAQIRDEGWLLFMVKYFYYNITKGYTNNPYEQLARDAAANIPTNFNHCVSTSADTQLG